MRIFTIYRIVVLGLLLTALTPVRADNLLQETKWTLYQPSNDYATLETISAGDSPLLRITVHKAADVFYKVGISGAFHRDISSGTRLRIRFQARSVTKNSLRAVVEMSGPPYNSIAQLQVALDSEWKDFETTGTTDKAYSPGSLAVRFQFGQQVGTLEIRKIVLEDIGPSPALISARAAITSEAIQSRIRKHRMGELIVRVTGRNGKPVPGVVVKVEQTRHAFLFGCNIFALAPNNSEQWQKDYQERFRALFNYATLPFYWGAFEPEKGKRDSVRLESIALWCRENGITTKGHPLIWHEVYPNWAPKEADAAVPLLRQRVFDLIPRYNLITYWDVLNEANIAASFNNGEGAWIKREGAPNVVQTALQWARDADKSHKTTLIYNDFNIGEENVALLSELQKRNTLPDAIGLQSHMHGGTWPLEKVWMTADTFAKFGKPVHFTELTVLSGPVRENVDMAHPPTDWNSTREEEAAQADYLEKFYTLLFSHPGVQAITQWDFSDRGAWQNAPAGLLRKDMSPKPAYERLYNLIKRKWWTTAKGKTNAQGQFTVRSFYGNYHITVSDAKGHTVTRDREFETGATNALVSVRMP